MPHNLSLPPAAAALNLDQYFGLWAVEPDTFGQMVQSLQGTLAGHVAANSAADVAAVKAERVSRVEIVHVNGTLTKRGSSLSGAGSMVRLRQTVRAAAQDKDVGAILLVIDSPGGTVSGTADLASEIAAAAKAKPVTAYIEDLGASAAYWLASQATRVVANNRTAKVGSIGTYMAVYDLSRMAANEGIEAVVISTGGLKGAGFPGTQITAEQREYWQSLVNSAQSEFTGAIAAGRRMTVEQVTALATGRVWPASEAMGFGLVDAIGSLEGTISELQADTRPARKSKRTAMSATYLETLDACDGIDPLTSGDDARFVCRQLDAEATSDQARTAWTKELKRRADSAKADADKARADAEKAQAEAEAARKEPAGVEPLEERAAEPAHADAKAEWDEKVAAKVSAGKGRQQAASEVNRENPGLRQRMVDEANARGK